MSNVTPQEITLVPIHIDPSRIISSVDQRIYSGFTEHMGRCIYGGIYDPENMTRTKGGDALIDENGFRKDVLEALKALNVSLLRYPGGNFVSTYRWQDGIGPPKSRPRRPDLAWLTEESNQFGTDEFLRYCKALSAEPFICLNMSTATLADALGWVEYCNGTGNTYYANLRRQNGHQEPYNVKYWALGNEMWGPWQVGQLSAEDYAKTAFQWAKALRLLDPSIKLVSCGETGFSGWDRTVLQTLSPMVDYHSIHLYTISQGDHMVNVTGPAAAEKGIQITRSLIDLSKIENGLCKELTICFDEWNVWDPVRAPGEQGAEEHYDLSDALAVAAWLNVFVRNADVVKIACIAQSVNVISPIVTSPSGLYRQTTYFPLHLFSNLMLGSALDVHIVSSPYYTGETSPKWIKDLEVHVEDGSTKKIGTRVIDVSAVLCEENSQDFYKSVAEQDEANNQAAEQEKASGDQKSKEIRVSIVNRSSVQAFSTPIFLGPNVQVREEITVYEIWHESLGVRNGFPEEEGEKVKTVARKEKWEEGSTYLVKEHSFQILVFKVICE